MTNSDTTQSYMNSLAPGQGKVVEINNQKVAVYKNNQGKITTLSAVCTHMGCIVGFNTKDQTWDCPCHGSRFQPDGKVIQGPAVKNLRAYRWNEE